MYQFTEIFQNIFLTLTFSIASLEPGETCTATMSRRHSAGDISRCPDMEWCVLITSKQQMLMESQHVIQNDKINIFIICTSHYEPFKKKSMFCN